MQSLWRIEVLSVYCTQRAQNEPGCCSMQSLWRIECAYPDIYAAGQGMTVAKTACEETKNKTKRCGESP